MPKFWVTVTNLQHAGFRRTFVLDAPSEALLATGLAERFDKREWGWDIHAYSVNGEDF